MKTVKYFVGLMAGPCAGISKKMALDFCAIRMGDIIE